MKSNENVNKIDVGNRRAFILLPLEKDDQMLQIRAPFSILVLVRWFSLLTTSLVFISACSTAPEVRPRGTAPSQGRLPPAAQVTLTHDDREVGQYVSSWFGFRTSSYWIEGPTGLILIDTQFLPSAATEMVDWAEKITGKKAVLAIILHPNPDKFNGTETMQKRGIRVITSEQVLKFIPAVHQLRTGWFYETFKPDYPANEPKPESFGSETREISAGGLTVKLHVLGAGCSEAHVVVEFKEHVFVGDLVTQGFHSWLELGLLDEWQKRIEEIKNLEPQFVHTGRGGSASPDALDREQEYLSTVVKIVKSHHPRMTGGRPAKLSEKVSGQILTEILNRYPAYDYPKFVENGLEPVWQHYAIKSSSRR